MQRIHSSLDLLHNKLSPECFKQLQAVIAVIQHGCKINIDEPSYLAAMNLVFGTIDRDGEMPKQARKHYGMESHLVDSEILEIEIKKFNDISYDETGPIMDKAVAYYRENKPND